MEHLIKKEWDVYLKRNVLVIQQVRTPIHVTHVFKDVRAGHYVIKLRFRLSDSKSAAMVQQRHADRNPPAILAVSTIPWSEPCYWTNDRIIEEPLVRIDKSVPLVKQLITSQDWISIWQTQSLDYSAPNMDFADVKYDRDSDWFFLELKDFKLKEKCHVQVEFVAEHDHYWKRNMVWDFLELRQLCYSR